MASKAPPNAPTESVAVPLAGVEACLKPDVTFVRLHPEPRGVSPEKLGFPFHNVPIPEGTQLTLTSSDGKAHKLRVTVQGADRRWRPFWVKWFYATREARELQGGDAAQAQDAVYDEGKTLHLMLFPGESRSATLEFVPHLDGETAVGDYLFDVVVEDITESDAGALPTATVAGTLSLVHPSAGLLRQLPDLYGEAMSDLREAAYPSPEPPFFERYLRGFEDAHEPLKRTLDELDRLFGPYSTPADHLLWLAAWVCMPFDENWPEMKRRNLVGEAVELYRWRGTRKGLTRYLQIYTGAIAEINDQPVSGMRLGPEAKLGTEATKLGDIRPHTFVVTLAVPNPAAVKEEIVHDIIRYEKPAHTAYALRIVRKTSGSE